MKKLKVNKDLCIGCGACVAIDSEHFDFDDEGRSFVKSNEHIESDEAVNAIESCPTSAILYSSNDEDDDSKNENDNDDCSCDNCSCHCDHKH